MTVGDVWHFRARHLAFPGAQGFGRFARGGRYGRVIEVTNLDDSGPGSFRAAVEADGPRTVVFRVSGVIPLESPITVAHPYLTVAGQTAPGDGICLRGHPFGTSAGSSDIIVRHLRVRVGDEAARSYDGMGLGGGHTIFDHCSISWSIDEGLDSRTARNATFQRCIISEALDDSFQRHPHAFAASIGGDLASYHHNLLAHCTGRDWSLAGGYDNAVRFAGHMEIRNNVVYNWRHRTTDGGAKRVDFVGNYYKPGPATQVFHLVKPDVGSPADRQVYHIAGNVMEGRPSYDEDNWAGVVPNGQAPLGEFKVDAPMFPGQVETTSAAVAFEDVLADVGATLPRQDPIDRRIIHEVRTGTFTHPGEPRPPPRDHRLPDRPRPRALAPTTGPTTSPSTPTTTACPTTGSGARASPPTPRRATSPTPTPTPTATATPTSKTTSTGGPIEAGERSTGRSRLLVRLLAMLPRRPLRVEPAVVARGHPGPLLEVRAHVAHVGESRLPGDALELEVGLGQHQADPGELGVEDLLLERPPGQRLEPSLEDPAREARAIGQVVDPLAVAGVLADQAEGGRDGRVLDGDRVGRQPGDDPQGLDQEGLGRRASRRP